MLKLILKKDVIDKFCCAYCNRFGYGDVQRLETKHGGFYICPKHNFTKIRRHLERLLGEEIELVKEKTNAV